MASDPSFASRLVLLPFDGSIVDKKGAVWTAQGGTQTYVTGVYASTQALGSSPTTSRVQAPATTQANFGSANVAFEFWFKGTSGVAKQPFMIFSSRNAALTQGIRFFVIADTLSADVGCLQFDALQIGFSVKTSGFDLLDNAWHFLQIIRVGTAFSIRIGNVGDSTTIVYQAGTAVGSFSNSGFVAPAIGQEPTVTTFASLEGLQAFRTTTGALVASLPTAVPTAQWPDGPTATVAGSAGTYNRGTVIAGGGGKGFTSGKAATYARGAVAATGVALAAATGQAGVYAGGTLAGLGEATTAAAGQAGVHARGAVTAGVVAIAPVSGLAALWSQGVVTADPGALPGNAFPAGVSGASARGAASAAGAGAAQSGSAPALWSQGPTSAAGGASAAFDGAAGDWAAGALVSAGAASADAGGNEAAYGPGVVTGRAAGAAQIEGAAGVYGLGDVRASSPQPPSQWVFWSEPAESRMLVIEHEDRRAVIAGESREYRLTTS